MIIEKVKFVLLLLYYRRRGYLHLIIDVELLEYRYRCGFETRVVYTVNYECFG